MSEHMQGDYPLTDQDSCPNRDWAMPVPGLQGAIPKRDYSQEYERFELFHDDGRPYNVTMYRRKDGMPSRYQGTNERFQYTKPDDWA